MYLLDRQLVRSYIKAYVICLVSLLTLYVVVDLFTNLDEFTEHHEKMKEVMLHIGTYYGYKVTQIFDRLSEAICLLAATFTVALLQRNNELLPLLSAGVPTRRVVMPVLCVACVMLGLSVMNQEMVISRIGDQLVNDKSDPYGDKDVLAKGAYEPNGIHIEGRLATRKEKLVKKFYVIIPEQVAGTLINITAERAWYIPYEEGKPYSGGWRLTETQPERLPGGLNFSDLQMIDPGVFFLKTKRVDFEAITRHQNWFMFASTSQLLHELNKGDSNRLAAMAVTFHMRLTRPLLGFILVLMGLSVILRDQNRNVFISAGMCLVLCGLFFAAQFACKSLGDGEYLNPALAAWMPVLLFGPLSVTMFDAIHT
jgi:lipopolysaccharide export system permease protein